MHYSCFAKIYDFVMDQVPYPRWANFILDVFQEANLGVNHRFLEIASGTGSLLKSLENSYPNLFGIDLSMPMLERAQHKVGSPLVQADMKKLPFANKIFDGIFCAHDSINYLRNEKYLREHFKEIKRVLKPNGVYIFDVSTEKNIVENFHDQLFCEIHHGVKMSWRNHYNFIEKELTSILEFSNDCQNNLLKKRIIQSESHIQKIYDPEFFTTILSEMDFHILGNFADYDRSKLVQNADILVYIISH